MLTTSFRFCPACYHVAAAVTASPRVAVTPGGRRQLRFRNNVNSARQLFQVAIILFPSYKNWLNIQLGNNWYDTMAATFIAAHLATAAQVTEEDSMYATVVHLHSLSAYSGE
jgi:hypothetical protein